MTTMELIKSLRDKMLIPSISVNRNDTSEVKKYENLTIAIDRNNIINEDNIGPLYFKKYLQFKYRKMFICVYRFLYSSQAKTL